MKEIANKVWNEPAAAIGLLVSLAMLAVTLAGGEEWDWETFVYVAAPFLAGIGIRPLVRPNRGDDPPPTVTRPPEPPRVVA